MWSKFKDLYSGRETSVESTALVQVSDYGGWKAEMEDILLFDSLIRL